MLQDERAFAALQGPGYLFDGDIGRRRLDGGAASEHLPRPHALEIAVILLFYRHSAEGIPVSRLILDRQGLERYFEGSGSARHYFDLPVLAFAADSTITVRTSRFQPGCDLSRAAVAHPRKSQSPSATPGERLTPMLQCSTIRSAVGQFSRNSLIARA